MKWPNCGASSAHSQMQLTPIAQPKKMGRNALATLPGLVIAPSVKQEHLTLKHLHPNSPHFNDTPLGHWAETQRLKALPLGVRVLARRRNLPVWRALAISEIAGFGGLHG